MSQFGQLGLVSQHHFFQCQFEQIDDMHQVQLRTCQFRHCDGLFERLRRVVALVDRRNDVLVHEDSLDFHDDWTPARPDALSPHHFPMMGLHRPQAKTPSLSLPADRARQPLSRPVH